MVTTTEPSKVVSSPATGKPKLATVPADQRIVIRGMSWDLYDRLSDAVGERQHVYLTYDGKDLELMTKGRFHEAYKELISRFVMFVTSELRIRSRAAGETTWKRPEIERGLEADQCYYFMPEKLKVDATAHARKAKDIAEYPDPDLAIEIDISPSQVDRPGIYAALQVAEVWRFDGESVVIERLGPDGTYATAVKSLFLPVRAEEVRRWDVEEDSSDELAWEDRLRAWARTELGPRMGK
jgi:Uma2 family endonuclease